MAELSHALQAASATLSMGWQSLSKFNTAVLKPRLVSCMHGQSTQNSHPEPTRHAQPSYAGGHAAYPTGDHHTRTADTAVSFKHQLTLKALLHTDSTVNLPTQTIIPALLKFQRSFKDA
jgi:hypothetical protein